MSAPAFERMPPHDPEHEDAVVAALMVDCPATAEIMSTLRPQDFFRERNRWAFEAAAGLWVRGVAINQLTVARELSARGQLEDAGGQVWLSDIVRELPTPIGAEHYAAAVRRDALSRELLHAGWMIQQLAYDQPGEFSTVRDRAMSLLLQVGGTASDGSDTMSFAELLEAGLSAKLEADMDDPGRMLGLTCGIAGIDRLTRGFQAGRTYYIAAETSIGKSLLVQDIAVRVAAGDCGVIMFTTEMGAQEVGERMVYMLAGLDPYAVRSRKGQQWTPAEARQIREAQADARRLPMRFCDRQDLNYGYLRTEVLRQRAKAPVDLIIVDHIQAMGTDGSANSFKAQRLEDLAHGLKNLSREFEVPVIVVSQLSRATDRSSANLLSRLRDSSGLEQWADMVAFLLPFDQPIGGERVYLGPDEARARSTNPGWTPAEFLVLKHRAGPTGPVTLVNDWRVGGRYYDWEGGWQ